MINYTISNSLSLEQSSLLEHQWKKLAQQLALSDKLSDKVFETIKISYSEPHRSYHNLSHLYSIFQNLKIYFPSIDDNTLNLAIWFHDIIYDSSKKDNEQQSAKLFHQLLSDILTIEDCRFTEQLILSTMTHSPLDISHNKILLDLDLAILATDRNTYEAYSAAIRKEYQQYPTFLYKIGRKKVLRNFLKREQIYYTIRFNDTFETIARDNLTWEVKTL